MLPGGGSVGSGYDASLVPVLREAGFEVASVVWEPGGNGCELLLLARRT